MTSSMIAIVWSLVAFIATMISAVIVANAWKCCRVIFISILYHGASIKSSKKRVKFSARTCKIPQVLTLQQLRGVFGPPAGILSSKKWGKFGRWGRSGALAPSLSPTPLPTLEACRPNSPQAFTSPQEENHPPENPRHKRNQ